jgi:hypothetical protein
MAHGDGRRSAAVDTTIVKAKIHPAIGIARIGNSPEAFNGPEVGYPTPEKPGFYRDRLGGFKRQAARFRIYGYNVAGDVVAELTPANAIITWGAHLRNEKAAWYEFQLAMDIPEVKDAKPAYRRNAKVTDRTQLEIDGGTVTITGKNTSGSAYEFNGKFCRTPVYLGELQTDEAGRLIVLGGRGVSASPDGLPLTNFANNDGWYDDTSDGPVFAEVTVAGQPVQVDHAWVVVAPPNYAPNLKTVRTLYDLLFDVFVKSGELPAPNPVSFTRDILPIFQRMSGLQWVNEGFHRAFGYRAPLDFGDPNFLLEMSQANGKMELPKQIANSFRDFALDGYSRTPLPWIYGDAMDRKLKPFVNYNCALSDTQLDCLRKWARGQFAHDYNPTEIPPGSLDVVPLAEQPAMLDRAALEFCLADAFHPGCEITWPIRHATMFMAPFRILSGNSPPVDYGEVLTPDVATGPTGPLYGQAAGGLSRWMAVPWQADTASCRSGYDENYDPYLPTFWPARVPNQILYLDKYRIAIDRSKSPKERHDAFNTRPNWYDAIPGYPDPKKQIAAMIDYWPFMGLVEQRPGATDDPDLPAPMQISTDLPPRSVLTAPGAVSDPAAAAAMEAHARALAAPPAELSDEWAGRFAWRRGDAGD